MSIYFQNSWQRAFGTFPLDGPELAAAIDHALNAGYRAFDTAQMYGNEATVGESLANSGIQRSEFCITTKVRHQNFAEKDFLVSVEESLKKLKVSQIDVLLLHWPPPDGDIKPPLLLLEQASREGFAAHIGVSNFTSAMMRDAVSIGDTPLVTNQVEFHPLLDQAALLQAAAATGIPLSSYCSVARGKIFDNEVLGEIAEQHGRTKAQIALRWILQKGVSINTMSTKVENIEANFQTMDFILSSVDMANIDELNSANYRIVDKQLVPWAPDWD